MSDTTRILRDSAGRMFADACTKVELDEAERGAYPEALHALVVANGFLEAGAADEGFEFSDVFELLKVAGRYAMPLPLAEMILARRWLPDCPEHTSIGLGGAPDTALEVPWGRHAERVLWVDRDDHEVVCGTPVAVNEAVSLAGEPRDTVRLAHQQPVAVNEPVFELLAHTRVALMCGALERVLEMGIVYASEREQFGRPIAKFQAIQHLLAVVAAEVAASKRATDAAIDAIGRPRFAIEVAVAKARVGEAAGIVAEAVHQVHGAMGYTHEHTLHHLTRRLWAWRDEYGNEVYWQQRLGSRLAGLGADRVWDFVATVG
jgi:acyl-CoA dehydrogenase